MGAPMTQEITLEATFSGADREAIARSLVDVGLGGAAQVKVMRTPVVRLVRPGHALDVPSLIDTLARVPFQLATFRALFPEWNLPDAPLAPPPVCRGDHESSHASGRVRDPARSPGERRHQPGDRTAGVGLGHCSRDRECAARRECGNHLSGYPVWPDLVPTNPSEDV
jgi:hypothetical protein